jgi:hypothetical protein
MKMIYRLLAIFVLSWGFASCEYDNYEPPQSPLQGTIVYNGEPIPVATEEVYFELWEDDWQLRNPINVAVAEDGTYSALLYDGPYKLVFRDNQGPFRMKANTDTNSDTILVNVRGATVLDIEVEPYYMIRNPQISMSGEVVNASASLEQIITDEDARNVEQVALYINRTQFVNQRGNYHIANTELAGGDIADMNNISLSLEVPDLVRDQSYVYARIGVKIEGVEDMIFSQVERLEL